MEVHYYIEYLGNSVELPLGETIVGRDVGCRLRFNDPALSRRHVRFVRRADEVFVEDLGSSNGTTLNGRPVTAPVRISDGDALIVGGRTLFVRVSDDDSFVSKTLDLAELPSDAVALRSRTGPLPVIIPPPNQQRCPNCGSMVGIDDDECEACRYSWGGFRTASRTDVRTGVTRRRHERWPVELRLVYVSSALEIETSSRDLSPAGVFVVSQVLEPVGTHCRLTFLVDGGPPVEVRGVVRRVVERVRGAPGLGVEFSRLGEHEKAWIERLIARSGK
ncbi:MAG TPA: FHA domain-containing protein [Kofleriaceae bacterium]|nr:FHA domain-containing protein [Kofleriaceae bacterium]